MFVCFLAETKDRYKANFIRLENAVFTTGHFNGKTDDEGIDPWFSGKMVNNISERSKAKGRAERSELS